MNYYSSRHLRGMEGRHIISEPHMRVQILSYPYMEEQKMFDSYHGELLIQILEGKGILKTNDSEKEVRTGDQILLVDGEPFHFSAVQKSELVLAQFIWTPGLNPCKFCWQINNRFYGEKSITTTKKPERQKWWKFWK